MDQLITRPYTSTDAAAVTDLLNAIEAAGGAGHVFTEAGTRDHMAAEVRDADQDSHLLPGPDGALAAAGWVSTPPQGGSRADTGGGVHPRWRGRGIGRSLLSWQLERIAEIRAEQDPASAWTVETGAGTGDESAAAMFERFGLRPVRYFIEMRAPTAGARLLRPPDGIRIVEFSSALLPAVHESHTEAFADHWGFEPRSLGEWAARTVESDLFRSDLSRIALADDQAAAYVLAYDGPEKTVYFGQVGTRRPWRQQGLASTLLTASLAAGAADGKTTASLGVDADSPTGAVSLYERLGFTALHPPFAVYEKPLAC